MYYERVENVFEKIKLCVKVYCNVAGFNEKKRALASLRKGMVSFNERKKKLLESKIVRAVVRCFGCRSQAGARVALSRWRVALIIAQIFVFDGQCFPEATC